MIGQLIEPSASDGPGAWVIEIVGGSGLGVGIGSTREVLGRIGSTPLPPYILHQRKVRDELISDDVDRSRYQTIYADQGEAGSVAAPTAGLHFTDGVMSGLADRGVTTSEVVLHVGAGTFKPVDAEELEDHVMHFERCSMWNTSATFVRGKPGSGRTIAVGSTSARTLESFAGEWERGGDLDQVIDTDILISPGYRWRWVDGMVTNFHLPRSTLIAMIASILEVEGEEGSGIERVQEVYGHAIREGYRFYSFGDAMLILP